MTNLDNSIAIITGASSGMGKAIAKELAKQHVTVVLTARRRERLESLVQEISENGGKAMSIPADLTNKDEAEKVVKTTIEKYKHLDILVNTAGIMLNGDSIETPVADWDSMVNINLRGLMYITKAAQRKVSDVINISSVGGRLAAPQVAIYSATKFAVTAATEAWRQEYTKQHIRFSVIEPGKTATELFSHREGEEESFEQMFGKIESLQADDIAELTSMIINSPRRVAINEIVVRPTEQV